MFRSATVKLTLWYIALVMAISLIFSSILYDVGRGEVLHGLNMQTARITRQFPVFDNDPLLHPGDELRDSDHRLLLRLVLFNAIVLVAAGFASYWLARRTLLPIEEAHEQQKRFTADVSHELRTPLTSLKMEAEVALMNDDATKADLREVLTSNLEDVAKLETLINNLLRLTRLEADELQQNFTLISVAELVQDSIAQISPQALRKEISTEVALHVPVNQEALINGDYDSLRQLLIILLDNAIKYSPQSGSIGVRISKENNAYHIAIRDHGTGIEPVALDHIFERFYRADRARTDGTTEGYGLGLSIAKMIADVHAAQITISSQLQKGTTATVTIAAASGAKNPKPLESGK